MLRNAYAITFMPLSGLVLNVHCRSTLNLFKYYQSANRIELALIAFNGFRDFLLKHNLTWNEESFVVGNFSLTIFLVFSLTIRNYILFDLVNQWNYLTWDLLVKCSLKMTTLQTLSELKTKLVKWPLTLTRLDFLRVVFSRMVQFDPPFIFQEQLI